MGHNIMLDLETLGVGPNAAIIAIGAVRFDPETGVIGDTFYRTISLESAVQFGGVIEPNTVVWWMEQPTDARLQAIASGIPIYDALTDFSDWVSEGDLESPQVWGNGANFDNVILSTAYTRLDIDRPWKFYNDRCFRTLKNLVPVEEPIFEGTKHNALEDAIHQAKYALEIFRYINDRK
jgi:exodeoxyribonuclease VIII